VSSERGIATPSSTPLFLSEIAALQESAAIKSRPFTPFAATPKINRMKYHHLFWVVTFAALSCVSAADPAQYTKSLVIVEGDSGVGSGSIIKFKGNSLIVTNAHVLSGNRSVKFRLLNSRELKAETIGTPYDRDILVAKQNQVTEGLEASETVDADVAIGDEVVVLGNSQGSSVVTEIKGKVSGIGPDLIEVDAKFVLGNSGSPIIHVKTGKVIAIATFVTIRKLDTISRDSQFKQVRRFGYRLDTISKWHFLPPEKFLAEGVYIAQAKRRNDDLLMLAQDLSKNMRVNPNRYERGSWVGYYATKLGKGPPQPGDYAFQTGGLAFSQTASEFRNTMNNDLKAFGRDAFAPYHQRALDDEIKTREVLYDFLKDINWEIVRYSGPE
jgi:Trypsin-like peptidase domain